MTTQFFKVGPFAKNYEIIDDFSSSMYLQKLYTETVDQLMETQQEYDKAVLDGNKTIIKTLDAQLKFLENVISLANNNMLSFMSETVSYD